jgi:hypothetical protein
MHLHPNPISQHAQHKWLTLLFSHMLLDKKHALSFVPLYLAFEHAHVGLLPVLWHQSLLVLCQYYAVHLISE